MSGRADAGRSAAAGAVAAAADPASARRIAVACSGGRDSIALLHATLRAAVALDVSVIALHVHHGLMPQADQWLAALRRRCRRWSRSIGPLRLVAERIDEQPAAGASVEAWARTVRYAALRRMAQAEGCSIVLLGHHRRDQAETFMLQALRGAGVAGLAAMPAAIERDGVLWLRPWLARPRSAIEAYLRVHRLAAVDDASNADSRFARSRLRTRVWPALLRAFPDAEQVLADAASRAADAAEALAELARIDLDGVADADGLKLEAWLRLSPARRRNLLRAWLLERAGRPAPASLLDRLAQQWAPDREAAAAMRGGRIWTWGDARLHASGGRLRYLDAVPAPPARGQRAQSAPDDRGAPQRRLQIDRPGRYRPAGWHGTLCVGPVEQGGIALALLADIELRPRAGGERFSAGPRRPARSLKQQFQSARVPAWQRSGPLLYRADRLIYVPGLGVDARAMEYPGEPRVVLAWQADRAESA